jgi:hypothetical protein
MQWLLQRVEQYRSATNDMGETILDFDDVGVSHPEILISECEPFFPQET